MDEERVLMNIFRNSLFRSSRLTEGLCFGVAALLLAPALAHALDNPPQTPGKVQLTAARLTAENQDAVRKALMGITQARKDQPETKPVSEVEVDVATQRVTLTLQKSCRLALGEVQKALQGTGAAIDHKTLVLGRGDQMMVSGLTTEELSLKLKASLAASGLFDAVEVKFKEGADSTPVILGAPKDPKKPLTFSEVVLLIEKVDPAIKVADLVWSGAGTPVPGP